MGLFCGEDGGCGGEVWVGVGWLGENGAWLLLVRATGCGCANDHALLAGPGGCHVSDPLAIPYQKTTHRAPAFLYNPCVPYNLSLFPVRRLPATPGKNHKKPKDNS